MGQHTTIYIEENEEITSIVERIKKTPSNDIALVIPRMSFVAQSIVNLKILKSQSEKMGKKLVIVTRDALCRSLAEKVGFGTERKIDTDTLRDSKVDTLSGNGVGPGSMAKPVVLPPKPEQTEEPILTEEEPEDMEKEAGSPVDLKRELPSKSDNSVDIPSRVDLSSEAKPAGPIDLRSFRRPSRRELERQRMESRAASSNQENNGNSIDGAVAAGKGAFLDMSPRGQNGEGGGSVETARAIFRKPSRWGRKSKPAPVDQAETDDSREDVLEKEVQPETKKSGFIFKGGSFVRRETVEDQEAKADKKPDFGNFFNEVLESKRAMGGLREKLMQGSEKLAKKSREMGAVYREKMKKMAPAIGLNGNMKREQGRQGIKLEETQKGSEKPKLKPVLQKNIGIRGQYKKGGRGKGVNSKQRVLLPKLSAKVLIAFGGVLLLIAFVVMIIVLPKANIKVYPKKNQVAGGYELALNLEENKVDTNQMILPTQRVGAEIEASGVFEATGEAEAEEEVDPDKARGVLVLYNEFSRSPEVLVAETRFVTDKGLVFRSTEAVRIPGYETENGEVVPGEARIEVVADEAGAQYEIEDEKLMIPGLEGDERYEKVYARTEGVFKAPKGGSVKRVTGEDWKKAEEALKVMLQQKAEGGEGLGGAEIAVVPGSVSLGNLTLDSSVGVGSPVDEFEVIGKVQVKALAYKKADLDQLTRSALEDEFDYLGGLSEDITESLTDFSFNDERGEGKIFLKAGGYAANEINKERIKEEFAGLSLKQIEERNELVESMEKVEVDLSPFWVRSVPTNESRIKVEVVY